MSSYKTVKVRTSSYSASKDKWKRDGVPQQGSVSPILPHFLPKIPKGRGQKITSLSPDHSSTHTFFFISEKDLTERRGQTHAASLQIWVKCKLLGLARSSELRSNESGGAGGLLLSRNRAGQERRGAERAAARTKPASVLAERKLLMRLDAACRQDTGADPPSSCSRRTLRGKNPAQPLQLLGPSLRAAVSSGVRGGQLESYTPDLLTRFQHVARAGRRLKPETLRPTTRSNCSLVIGEANPHSIR